MSSVVNRPRLAAALLLVAVAIAGCGSGGPTTPLRSQQPATSPGTPVAVSPTVASVSPSTAAEAADWLLYQSGEGLARARPDGSDRLVLFAAGTIASNALHADWSPDGSQIVFQVGNNDDPDVWIADSNGSNPHKVFACGQPCINADSPAWSPDGLSVAFSELDEIGAKVSSKLRRLDIATEKVTTLASSGENELINGPRWSPDGRSIVLEVEDRNDPSGQYADHPIDSAIGVISLADAHPHIRLLTKPGMHAWFPDWHPTRDLIVFQAGPNAWWEQIATSESNLFTIRPDGSGLTKLTDFARTQPAIWLPAWSADGQSILVTNTIRATRENSIGELGIDGSSLQSLPGPILGAHVRQQPLPKP